MRTAIFNTCPTRERGCISVSYTHLQLELSGFPGVLVTKVMPDSPAAKAGLQEKYVMVKLGDVSLSGPQSVTEALSEKVPGDRITAVFYRKGKRETVEITLDGGCLLYTSSPSAGLASDILYSASMAPDKDLRASAASACAIRGRLMDSK